MAAFILMMKHATIPIFLWSFQLDRLSQTIRDFFTKYELYELQLMCLFGVPDVWVFHWKLYIFVSSDCMHARTHAHLMQQTRAHTDQPYSATEITSWQKLHYVHM